MYGWNIFESIRYEIIEEKDKQGLLVHVRDKSWGPNYLQLGLALSTDFEGDSTWDIGVSLLKTALNRRAGELRLAAQIGESPLVFAELYQPLDVGLRYFITPTAHFSTAAVSVDSRAVTRSKSSACSRYGGGLAAGRVLGRWGEIRVGLRRYAGDVDVRIGEPATPDFHFDSAEAYLRLYYDMLDNRDWPRSGAISTLEWIESVEGLGADSDFSQLLSMGGLAHSWEKNTFFGGFEFDYTADGVAPVQNRFRAGGFTKLSGFTQDQLSGQQVLLLRSGYYRRLGNIEWLPAYAGFSLEYGNVYEDRDDISLAPDEALLAGSVFVGMDTVLGRCTWATVTPSRAMTASTCISAGCSDRFHCIYIALYRVIEEAGEYQYNHDRKLVTRVMSDPVRPTGPGVSSSPWGGADAPASVW